MPIIRLELAAGRTSEQKCEFVHQVTRVAVETLKCKPESLDIVIIEVPKANWAKGGKLLGN